MATNQFTIWIENMDGNYVKTVCATKFVAHGDYEVRSDAVLIWAKKSSAASMSEEPIDAISRATPQTGILVYYLDLTDDKGKTVDTGKYNFTVEGNLRWKNRIIYTGTIEIGNGLTESEASSDIFYEESGKNKALEDGAKEDSMITSVKAK